MDHTKVAKKCAFCTLVATMCSNTCILLNSYDFIVNSDSTKQNDFLLWPAVLQSCAVQIFHILYISHLKKKSCPFLWFDIVVAFGTLTHSWKVTSLYPIAASNSYWMDFSLRVCVHSRCKIHFYSKRNRPAQPRKSLLCFCVCSPYN